MCVPLTGLEVVITSHGGNREEQSDPVLLSMTSSGMSLHPWLAVSHTVRMALANTGQERTCTLEGQLLLGGLIQNL